MKIRLCAYGNDKQEDKGIVEIVYNEKQNTVTKKLLIKAQGKCNALAEINDDIVLSRNYENKSYLDFYQDEKLVREIETNYFYNYIQPYKDKLLLASFASGVDAYLDLKDYKIKKEVIHQREGYDSSAHSHYIHPLKDGRIISVENGYNQLYVYDDFSLEKKKVIDYEPLNIRLMNFVDDEETILLNTEKSNELLQLNPQSFMIEKRFLLTDDEKSFSGGHAISSDGKWIFVGNRGEESISVFCNEKGNISFNEKIKCGKTPRDMFFANDLLFVSCSNENAVEVYEIKNNHLEKRNYIEIFSPITFAIKEIKSYE